MNRFNKTYKLLLAMSVSLGILAQNAFGVEAEANVTLASDYSFRGVSQTGLDPAIQGGFDIALDNGFSIGTWASNVNFNSETSMELNLYASWESDTIGDLFTLSASIIRFEYPSEGDVLDYMEYSISANIWNASLGFNFSNEYFGADGPSFIYPFIGVSWEFEDQFSVDAHVGWSSVDSEGFFAPGEDSYMDASLSITVPIAELDVTGSLVGSTLDDPSAEFRFVLSIGKSF
ncbi:MAG: hypothetical protein F4Z01_09960 [Gammaproteobacteria bacterium]|nr:hypothetical protein [Gammaproteobacteria bacterium]MYF37243.1 hypothetical protein [Gammaproteobacteria bacterium]